MAQVNDRKMTLAQHAEAWWAESGRVVPAKGTPEYEAMYEQWVAFAFQDFAEHLPA